MNWAGKVVVVTGGATGIGAATAKLFADKGAKVAILDVNDGPAEAGVAAIKAAGGDALYVRTDVGSEKDVRAATDAVVKAFGRIDGLINNAGIMYRHETHEGWTMDEVRKIMDVNLMSQFLTTYAMAPIMAKGGGGSIVNIASMGAIAPVVYSPIYAATKSGVLGLTRSIAPQLIKEGIRVNAVLPNFVDTPMTANAQLRGVMPMLAPIDLARGIFHVASDIRVVFNGGGFYSVEPVGQRARARRSASSSIRRR